MTKNEQETHNHLRSIQPATVHCQQQCVSLKKSGLGPIQYICKKTSELGQKRELNYKLTLTSYLDLADFSSGRDKGQHNLRAMPLPSLFVLHYITPSSTGFATLRPRLSGSISFCTQQLGLGLHSQIILLPLIPTFRGQLSLDNRSGANSYSSPYIAEIRPSRYGL